MSRGRVAVLGVRPASGEVGGAERFYEGLAAALGAAGAEADLVSVISDERDIDAVKESYLRCYDLDLSAYQGVVSTKAPSYLVRHRNHVCHLVHTMRVFYDMFDREFPQPWPELLEQRRMIHDLDTGSLLPPRTKKVFCIGHEVRRRLKRYNGVDSEVLHLPLSFDRFRPGAFRHLFLPGRLHRWKRVHLVIEACKRVARPITLLLAGTGEQEGELRELAGDDPRIRFLGRVSDDELVALYADALAVPFMPLREDLGFVTLEAFKSGKPVITCADAGEPAHFVEDGVNGFVCQPDPAAIAAKIEFLHDHPRAAEEMGKQGARSIEHLSWERVAEVILSALDL